MLEHFRLADRPFSWWISPGDLPGDLAGRLTEAGLEEQETELAMSIELPAAAPTRPTPANIEIREAASLDDIEAFARINAENWVPPEPAVETFYREAAKRLLAVDSPRKICVALRDGEPAAAVELTLAGGVGGIYNLSTRSAHRRRGIGGALLTWACRRAAQEGAATVVLQASSAGAGLYRSFGFREFGLILELKPGHT